MAEEWLRLATAQAGHQPCMQMGEHGLEQVLVTSGSMNVHNSAFFLLCPLPLPMRAAAISQDVK